MEWEVVDEMIELVVCKAALASEDFPDSSSVPTQGRRWWIIGSVKRRASSLESLLAIWRVGEYLKAKESKDALLHRSV